MSQKTEALRFRVTADEQREIKRLCKKLKITQSELIRRALS